MANPNHDERGRFASGGSSGGKSPTGEKVTRNSDARGENPATTQVAPSFGVGSRVEIDVTGTQSDYERYVVERADEKGVSVRRTRGMIGPGESANEYFTHEEVARYFKPRAVRKGKRR